MTLHEGARVPRVSSESFSTISSGCNTDIALPSHYHLTPFLRKQQPFRYTAFLGQIVDFDQFLTNFLIFGNFYCFG